MVAPILVHFMYICSIISEECMRDSEGSSSFILTTSCGCCAVSTFQAVWYPKLIPVKSIYYAMDRVQLQPSVNTPLWLAPQSLPFWVKNALMSASIEWS